MTIKISIVTVCYNAEDTIEETIKSVLEQTYPNIEYIIVDGASQDKTPDIITRCTAKRNVRFISEPDDGIYDAMNKGIRMATGDYLQFLNAGDVLCSCDVVAKVAEKIKTCQADIVYGNILYHNPDGSEDTRVYGQFCSTLFYYLLGDCINHQAIFAARECLKGKEFDISYRICADREWMMRMKKQKYRFKAIDLLICSYSLDSESASVKNHDIYMEEAERCIREHLRSGYFLFWLINKIREGRITSKILHGMYQMVFIRK